MNKFNQILYENKYQYIKYIILLLLLILSIITFVIYIKKNKTNKMDMNKKWTLNSKISDVINDPVFKNYGRLLFPINKGYYSGTTLKDLKLTWYSNISPQNTVDIINFLYSKASSGEKIFYNIYTEKEIREDKDKKDTGLFFFKGIDNEKFAICNAGGGFVFVGAMHDSFPHALELAKQGYNAFALIYRPGSDTGSEDLARAISFVIDNSKELKVNPSNYSLWGGSAGARLAAWLGSFGTERFIGKKYQKPAAVIMQYTGLSEVYGNEPPTYNCVGTSDGIASYRVMKDRINRIKMNGVDAEIDIFKGLSHGFGLGLDTIAEGWLNNAVSFWERNCEFKKLTEKTLEKNINKILKEIPSEYLKKCINQGKLVDFYYDTYDSLTYDEKKIKIRKKATVYLPYEYNKNKKYNVYYLMHGGWSNETTQLGSEKNPNDFKNVIDNMINNKNISPLIIICPTYNNLNKNDSSSYELSGNYLAPNFYRELINDLMPKVETTYSTYAESGSLIDLEKSRDHRCFAGFSMGSVCTLNVFSHLLNYIKYYQPMSGSINPQYLDYAVSNNKYHKKFFLFAITGTQDFAGNGFKNLINTLLNYTSNNFILADNEDDGNVAFRLKQGYSHDENALREYVYNGLLWFFNH